jgi:lipooligosaccharide transport system permease protein
MSNQLIMKIKVNPPSFINRLFGVWFRHYKVYIKNIISNGFEPLLEPLFFLAGIGLGVGKYVGIINGVTYLQYLAAGIIALPSMYSSAFECSYGTFIRLEFDKVYDGMLSSSITAKDLLLGEIIFAGTKSFVFSIIVLIVISPFNILHSWMSILSPIGGLLTGLMFAALSLLVTSFIKTINHFSFYFTGLLTPMFFFSGFVFPLKDMPVWLSVIAEILPLTHSIRFIRMFCLAQFSVNIIWDLIYIFLFIILFSYLAIYRLEKRLVT